MSTVLAIDTSLNACQAGLFRDGVAVAAAVEPMTRGHQERLPVMVADLLRVAGVLPGNLDLIGVTLGPGSFTGLRVGLSFAKGMAAGLGRPLKGMGTLDALNAHPDLADRSPLAVIHGGRGRYYVQRGGQAPRTLTADDLDGLAADVVTGPAAADVPGAELFVQDWPSLDVLAALLMTPGHDDVTPLYMRDADAVASTRGIIRLEGTA